MGGYQRAISSYDVQTSPQNILAIILFLHFLYDHYSLLNPLHNPKFLLLPPSLHPQATQ